MLSNRSFLLLAVLGCVALQGTVTTSALSDVDVLNFALNLECLEAEFYSYAAYGHGIGEALLGRPANQTTGGQKAMWLRGYLPTAVEIAKEETNHVKFLRAAGLTLPCPKINIGSAFTAVIAAATNNKIKNFNAYKDMSSFLLAAFLFEDVGVTAYQGALPLLQNQAYVLAGSSISSIEAYHAGAIRSQLGDIKNKYLYDVSTNKPSFMTVGAVGNAITKLRDAVAGTKAESPLIDANGNVVVAAATADFSLAYKRSAFEVLRIVYGGGYDKGAFFTDGMTGAITQAPRM